MNTIDGIFVREVGSISVGSNTVTSISPYRYMGHDGFIVQYKNGSSRFVFIGHVVSVEFNK